LEGVDRFDEPVGCQRKIPVQENAKQARAGPDVEQLKGYGAGEVRCDGSPPQAVPEEVARMVNLPT